MAAGLQIALDVSERSDSALEWDTFIPREVLTFVPAATHTYKRAMPASGTELLITVPTGYTCFRDLVLELVVPSGGPAAPNFVLRFDHVGQAGDLVLAAVRLYPTPTRKARYLVESMAPSTAGDNRMNVIRVKRVDGGAGEVNLRLVAAVE